MSDGATRNSTVKRIVLAYSGGVTTSVAIPWLRDRFGGEVITVTLDLGQGRELAAVRERALALGAVRAHVIDARDEFVRDFVEPGLRAGLFAEPHLERTVQIAQPLIARRLVELARMESASTVVFGGSGSASLRGAIGALASGLSTIALLEDEAFAAADLRSLATRYRVQVPPAGASHVDATLFGRVVRTPDGAAGREDAYTLTRAAAEGPSTPAVVDIDFVSGVPMRTNGVEMSLAEMIESLETIAGAHGVGRAAQSAANVAVEAPAALVLQTAHQVLQAAVLGDDLATMTNSLATVYADLLTTGRWFSDVREAMDDFVNVLRPRVTGRVRLELVRGTLTVLEIGVVSAPSAAAPRAVA
jgi:argininosuccinate synthase